MTSSTFPVASVKTDKASYSQGENIEITGVMPPESYQQPILIEVFNPSHVLYQYKTLGSYFGTFSYTLVVGGPSGPPGTYRIRATYKNHPAESLFTITKRTLSIPPIHAYFFYLDIVKLTHPEHAPANQIKQLEALNSIISNSTYFAQIKALPSADRFIMPTGDGMV